MAVIQLIKTTLTNSIATVYTASKSYERATSIVLCNTSGSDVNIYLYIMQTGGVVPDGAIFSGLPMSGNSTLLLDEKILKAGYTIKAYASTSGVIAFSTDVLDY